MVKNVFILLCCLLTQFCKAQQVGAQVGLIFSVGTHVNAIGLTGNFYFQYAFTQLNINQSVKCYERSYGKRRYFVESRSGLGLMLLAGKQNMRPDFHFDGLNHNSSYEYALGFNYLIYIDNCGTSQLSGGWGLHAKYFSFLFENDVFGGQAKDRFRSGNLQLSYRYQYFKFFTNLFIWTGETKNSTWHKESMPNCPNGYRSLSELPFGKTSHGIVSAGIIYNFMYQQIISFKTGLDSEQIRHGFQNRLSHDLILLPKSYPRHTPHYPRLNEEGLPIFRKEERKKDKLFMQLSLNDFY